MAGLLISLLLKLMQGYSSWFLSICLKRLAFIDIIVKKQLEL